MLTKDNLWVLMVKRKYNNTIPMDEWIRKPEKKNLQASMVWKATLDSIKIIEHISDFNTRFKFLVVEGQWLVVHG